VIAKDRATWNRVQSMARLVAAALASAPGDAPGVQQQVTKGRVRPSVWSSATGGHERRADVRRAEPPGLRSSAKYWSEWSCDGSNLDVNFTDISKPVGAPVSVRQGVRAPSLGFRATVTFLLSNRRVTRRHFRCVRNFGPE